MKNLLLLHGALGSASQFLELQTRLAPLFSEIHAPNFPEHGGRAATDEPFSIARFSADLLQFLNEKGIERASFFGYSMGGYVALDFARRWPERVERVDCFATKFDWNPQLAEQNAAPLDPEKLEAAAPHFVQSLAERHGSTDWKTVVRKTAALLKNLGDGAGLKMSDLAEINCSVRIFRGELDKMVSREESELAAASLKNGQFVELPAVKHAFESIETERLVAAVF